MDEITRLKKEAKDLRRQTIQSVNNISAELEKIINSFVEDESVLISWDEIHKIPLNKDVFINNNIRFNKYYEKGDIIKVICFINAGTEFSKQKHNYFERLEVLKGSIIETQRNNREYKVGEVINYKKFEIHKPSTKEDSVIRIINKRG